jgi:hypothetical protein
MLEDTDLARRAAALGAAERPRNIGAALEEAIDALCSATTRTREANAAR